MHPRALSRACVTLRRRSAPKDLRKPSGGYGFRGLGAASGREILHRLRGSG